MRKPRRGYTLIEAMLTTVLLGTCTGIAGLCLQSLMQTDRNLRDDWQYTNNLARLELQLRRDATTTQTVEITEKSATLQLAAGNRAIYSVDPISITRVEKNGDETRRTEIYSLPNDTTVLWKKRELDQANFLEIEIQRETIPLMRLSRHGRTATPEQLRWANWLLRLGSANVSSKENPS